jgi:hypothetical protein
MMIRRLCIAILLGLLLGALFVAPASAVTYHGGTPAQQAYAQSVIEECWEPWQAVEQKLPGGVWLGFDHELVGYPNAYGVAWRGTIIVLDILDASNPYLGVVVAHEFCHQIWFGLSLEDRALWMLTYGWGIEWGAQPAEHFAECMRVALFPSTRWYANQTTITPASEEECKAFLILHHRVPWTITGG